MTFYNFKKKISTRFFLKITVKNIDNYLDKRIEYESCNYEGDIMDFTNAAKILELNIGKDKFLSLPEIEKQYRKLVKIYHPDLYVNDKKKYKWAHEKIKVINDAIEFVRNNYEDIKMKHEIKNAEEYEKAAAKRRAQKNEERKMREQEEAIRKEKFKYEEEIRRKEQKKKEEEERARSA